jgi:hypothetical protein
MISFPSRILGIITADVHASEHSLAQPQELAYHTEGHKDNMSQRISLFTFHFYISHRNCAPPPFQTFNFKILLKYFKYINTLLIKVSLLFNINY